MTWYAYHRALEDPYVILDPASEIFADLDAAKGHGRGAGREGCWQEVEPGLWHLYDNREEVCAVISKVQVNTQFPE